MPAISGAVILTLTDGTGKPIFVVYEFFNPATYGLRDATQATSRGNRTGALIIDNLTGRAQRLIITNPDTGGPSRNLNVAVNGTALTAATLAAIAPPNGPITTMAHLSGLMPSLTL